MLWVQIPPRAVLSLKKEKAVLGELLACRISVMSVICHAQCGNDESREMNDFGVKPCVSAWKSAGRLRSC